MSTRCLYLVVCTEEAPAGTIHHSREEVEYANLHWQVQQGVDSRRCSAVLYALQSYQVSQPHTSRNLALRRHCLCWCQGCPSSDRYPANRGACTCDPQGRGQQFCTSNQAQLLLLLSLYHAHEFVYMYWSLYDARPQYQ